MLPKTLCNDTFSNSIGTKLDIRHKNFEILSTVGMFGSVFGVSYCQVVQSRVWTCLHRCNKFLTFNIRGDNWWLLSHWLFLVGVGLLWGAQFLLWLGFVKFVLWSNFQLWMEQNPFRLEPWNQFYLREVEGYKKVDMLFVEKHASMNFIFF